MKYLSFRDGYWWVRITPKKELLPYLPIKTKEYTKSLGSVTESQAQRLAIPVINQWLSELDKAKELIAINNAPSTDASIHQILSLKQPTEVQLDKLQGWVHDAWGNPRNSKPSVDFKVRNDMTKGTGEAVLPYFYLDEYKKSISHLKTKTVSQRISRLEKEFLSKFKYLTPASLKTVILQNWIDSYAELDSPPATQTIKGYYQAAQDYLSWLDRKGYLSLPNAFGNVKLPSSKRLKQKIDVVHLEDGEIQTLLDAATNQELKDIIQIAAYTGCRIEEIIQLKTDNILTIGSRLVLEITDAKSKAGNRQVPVHQKIESIIERYNQEGYLFSGSEGKHGIRSDKHSKAFGRLKSKQGFGRNKVFHSLRKSFTTKLDRLDTARTRIQSIVGHEQGDLVGDVYSGGITISEKARIIDLISYDITIR